MTTSASWFRSLGGKLSLIAAIITLAVGILIAVNISTLTVIGEIPGKLNQLSLGRSYGAELSLQAYRATVDDIATRNAARLRLSELINLVELRFNVLLQGDPVEGLSAITNMTSLARIQQNQQRWNQEARPQIDELLRESSLDAARARLPALERSLTALTEGIAETVQLEQEDMQAEIDRSRELQVLFGLIVAGILVFALWVLNGVMRILMNTTSTLASASAELMAGTTQQAASAQEQAAAVAETVTTVDEVAQTSEQAAQRAKVVSEAAQRAAEIGKSGRETVDDAVLQMDIARKQTGIVGDNILALAEKAKAIGEIIMAVNEVAEQTNLLALNAGIEAARAGENGAGFTVVAREIRDLAGQARKATQQVRQLLNDIQKSTNSAVMATEEGQKSVLGTIQAISRAGDTIRVLADTIDDAAIAASQITASAAQQAIGMNQVRQAMRDINEATSQTTAATRQAESAAHDLNILGMNLKALLGA